MASVHVAALGLKRGGGESFYNKLEGLRRHSYVMMKVKDRCNLQLINTVANVHQYSAAHPLLFFLPLPGSACTQRQVLRARRNVENSTPEFPHAFFVAKE